MSIAEKILRAKDDYDAVYGAGKQAEYDRLVDPTKIIKKTVSDSVIRVDDVSEIPHKCTVSVDNDASVTVCGKNLINPDVVAFPSNYWRRDGEVFVSDKNTAATYVYVEPYLEAFKTYTFSAYIKPNTAGNYSLTARYNGATVISNYPKEEGRYSISVTPTQNGVYRFTVGGTNNDSGMIVSQLQLEVGSTATAYELYRGTTYAISAGQTIEVDSICPTMNLFADNDTTIAFGYHKSYGAQTEYDRFWDAHQENGSRTNFEYAFAGRGWTDETFKPKYDIKGSDFYAAFRNCRITDLREETIGVSMDFSGCTNFGYCFAYSNFKYLPKIDLSSAIVVTSAFNSFAGTDLSLIVSERTGLSPSTFDYVSNLVNLTISGTIAKSVSFQHSANLTKESIESVVNALSDTATGQTLTLSQTAVDTAWGTEDNYGSETGEWCIICESKPNWTITLV